MKDESILYCNKPTDIEKETGRKFLDIVKELISQGLSPTEITHKLKLKSNKYVSMALNYEKKKEERNNLDESKFLTHGLAGRNRTTIERILKYELDIDYKEWLYQKHMIEGLSAYEITKYLGVSVDAVHSAFKHYGIHKDRSQVRMDAIKNGLIDYNKISSKSRKTRRKSISGSNAQDMFRELIRHHLEINLFKLNDYEDIEIIIGANEWGILHNKEVDIPVIVIIFDQHYKYSIEYNNELWHEDKNDTIKEMKLIKKGWKHFVYNEPREKTGVTERMEKEAQEIAKEIINDISLTYTFA